MAMCGFWKKEKKKQRCSKLGYLVFRTPSYLYSYWLVPWDLSRLEVLWSIYILLVASQAYLLKPFRSLDPFLKNWCQFSFFGMKNILILLSLKWNNIISSWMSKKAFGEASWMLSFWLKCGPNLLFLKIFQQYGW